MNAHFEKKILNFIRLQMHSDAAHDIKHILRVVKTAKQLSVTENACTSVVVASAYLHDCVCLAKDHPQRAKSSLMAADKALLFLAQIDYPEKYFPAIHHAITAHSFSAKVTPKTLEAKILQDADRLDALGAIGISRCLQVGNTLNRDLYSLEDAFCKARKANDMRYTLDHFYSKLLRLENSFNCKSARQEAQKRTLFMHQFLQQLETEI
ncbi:metal-dependent phosphohydrolase [Psychromonas sp. CNPT3]|uniref:HD domain-containing protein n=1 Tax=Psychromonas sp. CNPT3 TaxID=314282 RepID=UPI00006E8AD4|nr:HD domain-containing protein [Psychromonas sp. CNPT3]AGH80519.1 metal-dependent phosphohydrolase [Psychromonas sp. CNPT3]